MMSHQYDLKPPILSRRATARIRKIFTSFAAATLLGAILFAASTAISNPAGAVISFSAPSGLSVASGGTITVDASAYATESGHTISCGTATGSGALFTAATFNRTNCSYEITVGSSTGTLTFTVPYTSTSTDTHNGQISIAVGNITALAATGCTDGTFIEALSDPPRTGPNNDLAEDCQILVAIQNHWANVSANNNLLVPNFLRTWGTGTSTQQRVRNWQGITVTDVQEEIEGTTETRGRVTALQVANTGTESGVSGTIPTQFPSLTQLATLDLSGHNLSGAIPTQLGSNTALTSLDLSDNQLTGAIPTQLSSLTALTSLDLSDNRLTSSVPTQIGTITTLATLGICNNFLTGALPTALRTGVTLTDYPTADGYDPIQCQNPTSIVFAAPQPLVVVAGNSISVNAADYASQGSFTISCSAASSVSNKITITNTGCSYQVMAKAASQGSASFTVPYASTSGATANGVINLNISNITFNAPTSLSVLTSGNITVNAASYASDGSFTISCGTATSVDAKITVANTGCSYAVTAGSTTGTATFTVPYSSTGGDMHNGVLTVTITASSGIIFAAPTGLELQAGSMTTINADNYASDGSFTISCGAASNVDSKISVSNTDCSYAVTAGSTIGTATFTVPYSSSGGDTHDGVIGILITPAPVITAPFVFALPSPSPETPPPEPEPSPDAYLRWNFFTAQQGGSVPTEISMQLTASGYPDVWLWNIERQRWDRVTLLTSALPEGTLVAFRTYTAPEEELDAVNLGTTRSTTISQGWSILSIPENLEREGAETFLFEARLYDCDAATHTVIIANYNTRTNEWHISLPCHPEAEAHYTEGSEADHNPLASISRTSPIYLYLESPVPIRIVWNADTLSYEVQ